MQAVWHADMHAENAHALERKEWAAAGKSEAISSGKELSGEIKDKDKTDT